MHHLLPVLVVILVQSLIWPSGASLATPLLHCKPSLWQLLLNWTTACVKFTVRDYKYLFRLTSVSNFSVLTLSVQNIWLSSKMSNYRSLQLLVTNISSITELDDRPEWALMLSGCLFFNHYISNPLLMSLFYPRAPKATRLHEGGGSQWPAAL